MIFRLDSISILLSQVYEIVKLTKNLESYDETILVMGHRNVGSTELRYHCLSTR